MGNNQAGNFTRRSFIRHASLFAMALPSLQLGLLSMWGCRGQSQVRAALDTNSLDVPSKIATVSNNEPGEPLIISGTIYAPDGRTPLPGMNLWVYQTDATGHYSKLSESGGDNRNTRIHGLLRTDADGRYEFRTIKPALIRDATILLIFMRMYPDQVIPSTGSMSSCLRGILLLLRKYVRSSWVREALLPFSN